MPAKRSREQQPSVDWVHQFLVVLVGADPLVWRRIQIPAHYSLWDLHVAIQDAMGWLDYHLHEFTVVHPQTRRLQRFGIPDDEDPAARRPDWRVHVSTYADEGAPPFSYLYDFGDGWRHVVIYEGTADRSAGVAYPRCIGGARKCPPEDCGGVHGYEGFLRAVADPEHPEHGEFLTWVGGEYDPDSFDPADITFDDPHQRWKLAFTGEDAV